jgi:hypothetical protein
VWIFDFVNCSHFVDDIKYGNNIIRAIEPLEDIAFLFYYLEEEDPIMNCQGGSHIMLGVFTKK